MILIVSRFFYLLFVFADVAFVCRTCRAASCFFYFILFWYFIKHFFPFSFHFMCLLYVWRRTCFEWNVDFFPLLVVSLFFWLCLPLFKPHALTKRSLFFPVLVFGSISVIRTAASYPKCLSPVSCYHYLQVSASSRLETDPLGIWGSFKKKRLERTGAWTMTFWMIVWPSTNWAVRMASPIVFQRKNLSQLWKRTNMIVPTFYTNTNQTSSCI